MTLVSTPRCTRAGWSPPRRETAMGSPRQQTAHLAELSKRPGPSAPADTADAPVPHARGQPPARKAQPQSNALSSTVQLGQPQHLVSLIADPPFLAVAERPVDDRRVFHDPPLYPADRCAAHGANRIILLAHRIAGHNPPQERGGSKANTYPGRLARHPGWCRSPLHGQRQHQLAKDHQQRDDHQEHEGDDESQAPLHIPLRRPFVPPHPPLFRPG
jgi:hypothetical protein